MYLNILLSIFFTVIYSSNSIFFRNRSQCLYMSHVYYIIVRYIMHSIKNVRTTFLVTNKVALLFITYISSVLRISLRGQMKLLYNAKCLCIAFYYLPIEKI